MTLRCLWPAAALLLSACASQTPVTLPAKPDAVPNPVISAMPAPVAVVHTARYRLVNLSPDDALRFPLHQTATHTFASVKKKPALTRGDGLRGWLAGTGYGLCLPVDRDARLLFTSPLPDVWRRAGPLRVEEALQAIVGSAWQMTTDEISRTVCFQRATQAQG